MGVRLLDVLMQQLDTLRYEPSDKRIRGVLGDEAVIDSERALLVWEPKRVVPTWAVPAADVHATIDAGDQTGPDAVEPPRLGDLPVYDPSVPFSVHTTEGEPVILRGGQGGRADGFRASDPELKDYVILDYAGFDAWYEEDERASSHPRDPFHSIDIVHSSRHVRAEVDGLLVADSTRPCLLFEPPLPVRYYLPAEDVRMDLLAPSDTRTACAYKGEAHYLSHAGRPDVAWTYPSPLRPAAAITDMIAFFNEGVDLTVDGTRLERPVTPWSAR